MARRRPTFATYAARRWRVLGILGVLLAGSMLVLAMTDRGHEPWWNVRTGPVDSTAASPDGSTVYALIREDKDLARLEARRGGTGSLLWESPLHAPRALLAASADGVAVATDFPLAFLTVYGVDGSVRFQVPLEGNPRDMDMERGRVALALQAPGNPLLVFEDGRVVQSHSFASFVTGVSLRNGRLAAGAGDGAVAVFAQNGTMLFNASLPISVRSLQMTRAGDMLLLGGYGLLPGDLSGALVLIDVDARQPIRWTRSTGVGVGLVAIDDNGLWAMAVEETPPDHRLLMFEAASGALKWTRPLAGSIARDDSGGTGGAALSPDGRTVAVATLRSDLVLLRALDGRPRWTFDTEGATHVAFPHDDPDTLLASGRLVTTSPSSTLLLRFSVHEEPFTGRLPLIAILLASTTLVAAGAILGVGYWRVRRTY